MSWVDFLTSQGKGVGKKLLHLVLWKLASTFLGWQILKQALPPITYIYMVSWGFLLEPSFLKLFLRSWGISNELFLVPSLASPPISHIQLPAAGVPWYLGALLNRTEGQHTYACSVSHVDHICAWGHLRISGPSWPSRSLLIPPLVSLNSQCSR